MGTQSLAMYLMASTGILPRFDYSIFVDTGGEKPLTYEILEWLLDWQKKNDGIPIEVVAEKNLKEDLLKQTNSTNNKFAPIPAFTIGDDGSSGMLRRQCTNEYKIAQIKKRTKKLLGLGKHDRYPRVINYMGFSTDEITRISRPSPAEKWHIKVYPFCNAWSTWQKTSFVRDKFFHNNGVSRSWIRNWLLENGYPDPGKSSCTFCPFMSNMERAELHKDPLVKKEVVDVDNAIRDSSKKGIKSPIYIHRSCKPIDEIDFTDDSQQELFNCTSGNCHI